jgi:hypothetical protein
VVTATSYGGLGAALGVPLGNPALAGYLVLAWSYAPEPSVSTLSHPVCIYLPGGDRESLAQHVSAHHYIPLRRWAVSSSSPGHYSWPHWPLVSFAP